MSEYEGKENLDIMSLAINYNNTIFEWIMNKENLDNKLMLEFGAGKGEFANRFVKLNKNILAIEIDQSMHQFLKCSVAQKIEDFDKKYDFIYSINVLEHIENDVDIINKFYKYLLPGGIVKIFVPARMEIYSSMDKKVGHFRRYDIYELRKKFEDAGFIIDYCKYFDFIGYFVSLLYKYINNSGDISEKGLKMYDNYIFPISYMIDKITNGSVIGKNLILRGIKK